MVKLQEILGVMVIARTYRLKEELPKPDYQNLKKEAAKLPYVSIEKISERQSEAEENGKRLITIVNFRLTLYPEKYKMFKKTDN